MPEHARLSPGRGRAKEQAMKFLSKFQMILSTLMILPALASETFTLSGDPMTREDGLDC